LEIIQKKNNNMNITVSIGEELGVGVSDFLKKTPEIQIYANPQSLGYQWRDGRFKETCDVWSNKDFMRRDEVKTKLMEHLKSKGDF